MDQASFQYWAFLSHSAADRRVCQRLQAFIESYRVPTALRRRSDGPQPPRRLRPLFRDRTDLHAGAALGESLETALREARFLIVLCSPAAARSEWVDREIRLFRALGRDARIIPVIVAGEPHAARAGRAEAECFPPALREMFAEEVGGAERIAADLRRQGDGWRSGALKVVAGMLGVRFDQLAQRDLAHQRRRAALFASAAALFLGVALLAAAGGVMFWAASEQSAARLRATQIAQSHEAVARAARLTPEEAVIALLETLPRRLDAPDRPFVAEAASLLALAAETTQYDAAFSVSPPETIVFARLSDDGAWLLAAAALKPTTLTLWEIETGAVLLQERFESGLFDAAIAPDRSEIAVATRVGGAPVALFSRAGDGFERRTLALDAAATVSAVAYLPDGRHLAAGTTEGAILIADRQSGAHSEKARLAENDTVARLVAAPDGAALAARGHRSIGHLRRPLSEQPGFWTLPVAAEAIAFDGAALAASTADAGLTLYDENGAEGASLGRATRLLSTSQSLGAPNIFRREDGLIVVLRPGEATPHLVTRGDGLNSILEVSAQGDVAALGQLTGDPPGEIRLLALDAPPAAPGRIFPDLQATAIAPLENRRLLAVGEKTGALRLVDPFEGKILGAAECGCGEIVALRAAADETALAVIGTTAAVLIATETLEPRRRIALSENSAVWAQVDAALTTVFLDDGARLLAIDLGQDDAEKEAAEPTVLHRQDWPAFGALRASTAFSPSGARAVAATREGLTVIDLATRATLRRVALDAELGPFAFAGDDVIAAILGGTRLVFLDAASGAELGRAEGVVQTHAMRPLGGDRPAVALLRLGGNVTLATLEQGRVVLRPLALPGGLSASIADIAWSDALGLVGLFDAPQRPPILGGLNLAQWDAGTGLPIAATQIPKAAAPFVGYVAIDRGPGLHLVDGWRMAVWFDREGAVSTTRLAPATWQETIDRACARAMRKPATAPASGEVSDGIPREAALALALAARLGLEIAPPPAERCLDRQRTRLR